MATLDVRQVGDGVFFARTELVSWVVLVEAGRVALIDAGYPGQLEAVLRSIEMSGARPEELDAVLVTHSHVDHVGTVPELVRRFSVDVYAGAAETPMLLGERTESATPLDVLVRAWRPRTARWGVKVGLLGGSQHPHVPTVATLDAGEVLDLPGSPVPISSPGHTSGHTVFYLPGTGAVALGDVIGTSHMLSAHTGPQVLPSFFHHDEAALREHVVELGDLDADVLLPGHGHHISMPIAVAVDEALSRS